MDQELKDFTWQELFFHVEEAIRKDSKGNKDIAKKAKKYPTDTIFFCCRLYLFTQNRYKHLKDQKEDFNYHEANKKDTTYEQV
jgi:hypothetical protein